MPRDEIYKPRYENSWALIIGINAYHKVSPLEFACGDAEGVSAIIQKRFQFDPTRIILLTDGSATRQEILQKFLSLRKIVGPDDRVLVFFAGHGHTENGRRGDVGFLVPVDGDPDDLSTLIRWDELTRSGDLIEAKHIFYIMDACYGGLAVTRRLSSGSMRFMKDMLQRYSRQVLSSGKSDEPVCDGGGPKPGHSIFTGHLLTALEGDVASPGGVLSANALMAYVYDRVTKDPHSRQSPHYGFIDGDGDFIFDLSVLDALDADPKQDKDVLVVVPPGLHDEAGGSIRDETELLKEYITDPKYRIKLDDAMTRSGVDPIFETAG
jgi:Caspase domain